jgi:hypothetical protein
MRKLIIQTVIANLAFVLLSVALFMIFGIIDLLLAKTILPLLLGHAVGGTAKIPGLRYLVMIVAVTGAIAAGYFAASGNKDRPLLAGFLSPILIVLIVTYMRVTASLHPSESILVPITLYSVPFFGLAGAFLLGRLAPTALRGWVGAFAAAALVYVLTAVIGMLIAALLHSPTGLIWSFVLASYFAIVTGVRVMPAPERRRAMEIFIVIAILIPLADAAFDALSGQFKYYDAAEFIIVNVLGCFLAYRTVTRRMLSGALQATPA